MSAIKETITRLGEAIAHIVGSAAKIVFLMLALTACFAFITGRLASNDFMVLAGAAFTFYFSHKGDVTRPYAGK